MIRLSKYLLIILMAMLFTGLSAQNSQVLYFMNLPQNHFLNPAMRPSNAVYIGLPAVSGINLNINNNFVNFSDVFMKGHTSDSVLSFLHPENNIDDFLDKIKKKNSLETELTIQLFGLGFSVGKDTYVFFDINERVDGNFVLPGDLFKLALKGNEGFVGGKIDLSSLRSDIKYYREFGLGFSRNLTNRLRIGVKGKLLSGIAAVSTNNRSLTISVNEDYSHTLDADLSVNLSAPLSVYMDSDQNIDSIVFDDKRLDSGREVFKYLTGTKNKGLGLDLGATYSLTDKIILSAALTDIGFIRWKRDVSNLTAESSFEFSGLNISDVIAGTQTFDELGQEMLDSLKNSFKLSNLNEPFTTWLPMGITLGGQYRLTKNFSAGLLSYSRIIGKQFRQSLTMSGNLNVGNVFSASLSYTATNHRFDNLGAGMALRAGIFQFYIMTDKIPVMWNKIVTDNSSVPLPASWNTVNLRAGMNLAFGNGLKKKKDKPMIIIE